MVRASTVRLCATGLLPRMHPTAFACISPGKLLEGIVQDHGVWVQVGRRRHKHQHFPAGGCCHHDMHGPLQRGGPRQSQGREVRWHLAEQGGRAEQLKAWMLACFRDLRRPSPGQSRSAAGSCNCQACRMHGGRGVRLNVSGTSVLPEER